MIYIKLILLQKAVVCKTKAIGTFFDAQAKNITSVL